MGQDRSGVVREQIERTESVHQTVLRGVSAATDQPVAELTPLQAAVDVNAMDTLMSPSKNCRSLQFQYMGFEITVKPDQVCIQEPHESAIES